MSYDKSAKFSNTLYQIDMLINNLNIYHISNRYSKKTGYNKIQNKLSNIKPLLTFRIKIPLK